MIQVIGIPFDANSSFLKGCALAPSRIRLMDSCGSSNTFSEYGVDVKNGVNYHDCGDIEFSDVSPDSAYTIIKSRILDIISTEHKVLSLGGDHSISFPIIEALNSKYPDLSVLQLDAHPDLCEDFDNNWYSHASPFARIMEKCHLKSLTQVGIRTLTDHQRRQAKKFGVNIIEMKDFNLDFVNNLGSPVYISIDLDVLDPAFAPGVSHHEPGGLTTRELLTIIQRINVEIIGADIVEYNPNRDLNNVTAMVGYKLMKELVAKMV